MIIDASEIKKDKEYKTSLTRITKAEGQINDFEVVDPDSQAMATNMTAEIKKMLKAMEDKRKSFVDPLNKVVKSINAEFKPNTDQLKKLETTLKQKMIAYYRVVEEARQKQIKKEQEANAKKLAAYNKKIEEGKKPKVPVIVTPSKEVEKSVKTEEASSTIRMVKKWELIDQSKLPEEYKIPDTIKLNKVVRAGVDNIPGVRIFEEPSMSIR